MIKSIAIQFDFLELCKLMHYAQNQAKCWQEMPNVASKDDEIVLETCAKIKKLILANNSTEFILMDKPF